MTSGIAGQVKKCLLAVAVIVPLASVAARHKNAAEIVIPRKCIRSTSLTDRTECRGPDMEHLMCVNTKMELVPGCGQLEVKPN